MVSPSKVIAKSGDSQYPRMNSSASSFAAALFMPAIALRTWSAGLLACNGEEFDIKTSMMAADKLRIPIPLA
jgi:hypothetical protein